MYDVIVVGAGPAGAVTARQLALRGVKPLLLEKAPALPRERACAGVATPRLLQRLVRLGLELPPALIRARLTRYAFGVPGAEVFTGELPSGPVTVVDRARFDAFLVEEAVRAGARLELGWALEALEPIADGGWRLRSAHGAMEARFVVVATGPRDTAALSDPAPPPSGGVGMVLDLEASRTDVDPHTLVVEVGSLPGGFFWLVPARRQITVGLSSPGVRLPHPRRRLHGFLERQNLSGAGVLSSASELFSGVPRRVPRDEPGLLRVGDHFGAGDPLSGLGLDGAVRTATAAAAAIDASLRDPSSDSRRAMTRRCRNVVGEQRIAARISTALYRSPARFLRGLTERPQRARELARSVLGLLPYTALSRRWIPTAFDRFLRGVVRH